ncbi:MAG TPA: hybrid sensor histidine kinase/response regulator, partial [Cyanobacteria bacterium UBA8553]|nr:hybrid sensor histidine kinase/response regulator [Cyanobacteria bacterium UBA8553]
LKALYEAAEIGYVQGIEQEVIRLQQLDPDYTPFTNRILELADNFENEEIVHLLDRFFIENTQ